MCLGSTEAQNVQHYGNKKSDQSLNPYLVQLLYMNPLQLFQPQAAVHELD